jgi:hypothetical protein
MTFRQRAIGAAKLDVRVFEEIEADRHATKQALGVVVLSSLAAWIGLRFGPVETPVMPGIIIAVIAWLLWAALTCVIGVYVMPEPQTSANVGELLRTIGFAAAPGILRVFGPIPVVGGLVYLGATIWMIVAIVVAIRQALDYKSTVRAIAVSLIAGFLLLAIAFVFVLIVPLSVRNLF